MLGINKFINRFSWILAALWTLQAQVQAQDSEYDPVGSDQGNIEITSSGQPVWNIPITVPPGVLGLSPNLSLSVSAQGQANLGGLSGISRCTGSAADHGHVKPVRFALTDEYCLDGQPLKRIQGNQGAPGSIYHTQIESFQKIEAVGQQGNGPASFKVTNRSGSTMYFGETVVSKAVYPKDNTTVIDWAISSLYDTSGNGLWYQYQDISNTGNPEVVLTKIAYGAKSESTAPMNIWFDYQNRPDTAMGYQLGELVQSTKRLAQITTEVDGEVARHFYIEYEQAAVGNYSRVKAVYECASVDECYRPSKFTYSDIDTGWTETSFNHPSPLMDSSGRPRGTVIDINNDGWQDWIIAVQPEKGKATRTTWLGSAAGFSKSSAYAFPYVLFDYALHEEGVPIAQLADIDGNGLADIVVSYHSGGQTISDIQYNTGSGWTTSGPHQSLPVLLVDTDSSTPSGYGRLADLNGDGLVDLIASTRNSGGDLIQNAWLNSGTDWQSDSAFSPPALLLDYYDNAIGTTIGDLIDINGDGLVDILQSVKTTTGQTINRTFLNTGQGWTEDNNFALPIALNDYTLSPKGMPMAELTDLNGDSNIDILQSVVLSNGTRIQNAWVGTGTRFISAPHFKLQTNLTSWANIIHRTDGFVDKRSTLSDVNGDSKPEQVISYLDVNGTLAQTVLAYQNGTWVSVPEWLSYIPDLPLFRHYPDQSASGASIQADINGDGRGEWLTSFQDNVLGQQTWETDSTIGITEQPGYLNEHTNGLGIATRLEYGVSTDPNLYTPAQGGAYPSVSVNGPMALVARVTKMDGLIHPDIAKTNNQSQGWYAVEHQYGGLKVDLSGRGSLGFATRSITDQRTGTSIQSEFYQNFPFTGMPAQNRQTFNGTVLKETSSEVASRVLNTYGTTVVYATRSTSKAYDPDTTALMGTTVSDSEYDDFGNVTNQTQTGTDVGGNSVTKQNQATYENRTTGTDWIIGLPTQKTTTSSAAGSTSVPPLSNTISISYNDKGYPSSETLEAGSPLSVESSYVYDAYGNTTATTISSGGDSRTSQTVYTSDGRFPIRSINPLGHETSVEFDARWGKPTLQTNAFGLSKAYKYNAFGTTLREDVLWDNKPQSREVALPYWCEGTHQQYCPYNAVYFVAALDDQGESPQTVYFDAYGRELVKQTTGADLDGDADADGPTIYIETVYDSQARKIKISKPGFDKGNLDYNEVVYDNFGRVAQRIATDGSSTQIAYQGLTTTTTNANGQQTSITKDVRGKPATSIDAEGNLTRFEYDAKGNLTKTIDSSQNVIAMEYDNFGHKIKMDDPDMGIWTYRYDGFGNLIEQVDAKNQATTMEYDALKRLITRTEPTPDNSGNSVTTWTYDNTMLGDGSGPLGLGLLSSVSTPSEGYERTHHYDLSGRSVEETTTIAGKTYTSGREYFRASERVAFEQFPSGLVLTKDYDTTGFPMKLESGDLQKFDDYLSEYYTYEDMVNEYNALKAEYQNQIDQYEIQLLGEKTGELDADDNPIYAGGGLEDQVEPFADDITAAIASMENWQRYLAEAGEVYNDHRGWYEAYFAEYQEYWDSYETNSDLAVAANIDGDAEIVKGNAENAIAISIRGDAEYHGGLATSYFSKATSFTNSANSYLSAARNNFQLACKATGRALYDPEFTSWRSNCASGTFGDVTPPGPGWGLGGGTHSVCKSGSQTGGGDGGDAYGICSGGYVDAYTWVPTTYFRLFNGTQTTLLVLSPVDDNTFQNQGDLLESNYNKYKAEMVNANNEITKGNTEQGIADGLDNQANSHATLANGFYGAAQVFYDDAEDYDDIASGYIKGVEWYGALFSNHGLVLTLLYDEENGSGRYLGYKNNVEQYSGEYACTKVADINHAFLDNESTKAADIQAIKDYDDPAIGPFKPSPIIGGQISLWDSDDNGEIEAWYVNNNTKQAVQAPKLPLYKRENCASSERLAKISDGDIDAVVQTMYDDSPFFERNYVSYQYSLLASPLNDLIDQANAQSDLVDDKKAIYQDSSTIYWEALSYTADGKIEEAKYGNGVESTWNYDERGRVNLIEAAPAAGNDLLQHMVFEYDQIGNLTQRWDFANDLSEAFQYDTLNRLASANLSGTGADLYDFANLTSQTFQYDALGNITDKSDVGNYTYGENGAGVHAVTSTFGQIDASFTYDANGNQISGHGRTIDYSAYNKPIHIANAGGSNSFRYGPERQMVYQKESIDGQSRETRYVGGIFEETIKTDNTIEAVHHLTMAGHTLAVLKTQPVLTANTGQPIVNSLHYLHEDHLNSVVMITDADGNVVEKNHYDAFGKKRLAIVDLNNAQFYLAGFLPITDRSFTGHRYLPGQELIHMKGRVFDPTFGRFLSADPHIQSPLMSQSLNRYSYVLNNPLSLTDPSGYFFSFLKNLYKKILKVIKTIIKKIVAVIKRVIKAIENVVSRIVMALPVSVRIVAVVVIAVVATSYGMGQIGANMLNFVGMTTAGISTTSLGIIGAFGVGFMGGLIMTGSLKGALIGGITAAAFAGVGRAFGTLTDPGSLGAKILQSGVRFTKTAFRAAQVLTHGLTGGVLSKLQGGSFSEGFKGAALGKLITIGTHSIGSKLNLEKGKFHAGQFALVTGAGYLVGGKMGARMAALGYLFNHMHEAAQKGNGNSSASNSCSGELFCSVADDKFSGHGRIDTGDLHGSEKIGNFSCTCSSNGKTTTFFAAGEQMFGDNLFGVDETMVWTGSGSGLMQLPQQTDVGFTVDQSSVVDRIYYEHLLEGYKNEWSSPEEVRTHYGQ